MFNKEFDSLTEKERNQLFFDLSNKYNIAFNEKEAVPYRAPPMKQKRQFNDGNVGLNNSDEMVELIKSTR